MDEIDLSKLGSEAESTPEEKARQDELMANAKIDDLSTEEQEIVGIDEGEEVVVTFIRIPHNIANSKKLAVLTMAQIEKVISTELMRHCERIGWFPGDQEGPDYVVKKLEDGSWLGVAKLHKSKYNARAKEFSEFPRVKVDERTKDDVAKGRITL